MALSILIPWLESVRQFQFSRLRNFRKQTPFHLVVPSMVVKKLTKRYKLNLVES